MNVNGHVRCKAMQAIRIIYETARRLSSSGPTKSFSLVVRVPQHSNILFVDVLFLDRIQRQPPYVIPDIFWCKSKFSFVNTCQHSCEATGVARKVSPLCETWYPCSTAQFDKQIFEYTVLAEMQKGFLVTAIFFFCMTPSAAVVSPADALRRKIKGHQLLSDAEFNQEELFYNFVGICEQLYF